MPNAGERPREHRGRADLMVGEHPKQLAEARKLVIEQRLDRLNCTIVARYTSAAGHDNCVEVGKIGYNRGGDFGWRVRENLVIWHVMSRVGEKLANQLSARVAIGCARISGGDHANLERTLGCLPLMLVNRHGC